MRFVVLLALLALTVCPSACGLELLQTTSEAAATEMEQRAAEVDKKVSPALIFVQESHRQGRFGNTGAVVTKDGYFVYFHSGLSSSALTVVLTDGRRAAGTALGFSREWGIAVGKLEGDGPWPFVPLESTPVRAGQAIATFAFALNEPVVGKRPLVDLTFIDRSSKGHWFAHSDGTRYQWQMRGGLAFDLEGRLLGIENSTYPLHGTIYTHVDRLIALWPQLIEGKNVDQVRLDKSEGEKTKRPPEISAEAKKKATEASVRVLLKSGDARAFVSGTIIRPAGLVVTCAHHFLMPGSKVQIALNDGRDVPAEVVGLSFPADVSLLRITEAGSYPHTEIGESTSLVMGDACLIVGYGPVERMARQPSVRTTKIVPQKKGAWSCMISTDAEAQTVPGDSGGGLFDSEGKLIALGPTGGIYPGWPNEHVRVEILAAQEEALHAAFEQADTNELAEFERAGAEAIAAAKASTVDVLDGDKLVALGSVVSADGRILTKASSLPNEPHCRLSDGRMLPAKVIKVVREHDLAILKIDASDLRVTAWAEEKSPSVGAQIAFTGSSPSRGTVAHAETSFEREPGKLNADFQETAAGLEVVELGSEDFLPEDAPFSFGPQRLQKGDVLLSLEGKPVKTRQELSLLLDAKKQPIGLAGDRMTLSVKRDGKVENVRMLLRSMRDFPLEGQTPRRSGFSRAYGVLKSPGLTLFGGAVLDREGRAVGVAIAARQSGWILVLPCEVARSVAAE